MARLTLLNAGYDAHAVKQAGGYQRVYSQVLPSATVQRAVRQALSGLPLDPSYLTANARLLVPPAVLESMVRTALGEYLQVVLGRADHVDLDAVLQPLVTHFVRLVGELSPGLLARVPPVRVRSLQSFDREATQVIDQLASGRLPFRLPRLELRPQDASQVAAVLTRGLPSRVSRRVRHRLALVLEAGDLNAAFALVLPRYLDQAAVQRLGDRLDRQADAAVTAMADDHNAIHVRRVLPIGIGWLTLMGWLLTASLLPLLRTRESEVSRELASVLGAGAVMAGLVWLLGAHLWQDPLTTLSQGVTADPALERLASDIDLQIRRGVIRLLACGIAFLALSATLAWLAPVLRRSPHRRWQPLVATGATAALGAAGILTVILPSTHGPTICNGSPALCQRRYNQVTYLTAHNAMASTDRGFLDADQDLDLIAQLDSGVRGLMLDLHYWTPPPHTKAYLANLDPRTRARLAPLLHRFRPKPGVWLCHNLCQLGADPAVAQLKQLRNWLSHNPNDVVTVILQDDISPRDVRSTLYAAGLRSWLATPPTPGTPWPQLGQLIAAHHTLFVFTERAAFPTGPVRSFYTLAAETPYLARTRGQLSCRPGRGPARASLFLINNWITADVPRRADALKANRAAFLRRRLRRCDTLRHMRANFVAVDFTQQGHPLATVDRLNHLR